MSLTLRTTTLFLTNKNPTTTTNTTIILKSSSSSSSPKFLISKSHLQNYTFLPSVAKTLCASLGEGEPYHQVVSQNETFNFDSSFLSILEFVSLASSAAISVYVAIYGVQKKGGVGVFGWLGNNILALQSVVLLTAIVVGAAIRRQQWTRICALRFSAAPVSAPAPNLLERVEKLEEDLRSSTTIIRVLSRHLEKLGIRFRLTRKALKEPIQETAALAQRNSEATRALAAQEDILEKELGEIQKVLLAMQEQQQKQLELILAIAKAGKLFETDHVQKKDLNTSETTKASADSSVQRQDRNASVDRVTNLELNKVEALARHKESNNERP